MPEIPHAAVDAAAGVLASWIPSGNRQHAARAALTAALPHLLPKPKPALRQGPLGPSITLAEKKRTLIEQALAAAVHPDALPVLKSAAKEYADAELAASAVFT